MTTQTPDVEKQTLKYQLQFQGHQLVKVNGMRPPQLDGYQMIGVIQQLGAQVVSAEAGRDNLKHDIARHLTITSEQATQIEALVAERDAALARVSELENLEAEKAELMKVLSEQTALVDRLLTIVDCLEQDIGSESPDKIWPELGPVNDHAEALLAALAKAEAG